MKKTIFATLIAFFALNAMQAQSLSQVVVSSSGSTISGASNTLSFTTGETVVGNIDNGESLGQGFWLGAIEGVVLGNDDFTFEVEATIYPNPVINYLNLQIKDMAGEDFDVTIYDITGKQVYYKKLIDSSNNETLDFSSYSSGMYMLNVVQKSTNKSKTFKIIKQ